jgi:uncharacterized protein
MDITGTQLLPVDQQTAWDALNDPDMLKASIMGCEELTRVSDTEFAAAVTAAIGPGKARFKAKLTLSDVNAPHAYTIRFDGQGGAAGFGKGDAQVKLTPQGAQTQLDYTAHANIGGKLAQIGSRLVDAAARKMADDFFQKFNAELARRHPQAVAAGAPRNEPSDAPGGSAGDAAKSLDGGASSAYAGDASSATLVGIVVALVGAVAVIGYLLAHLK